MFKKWKIRTKLGFFVGVPFIAILALGILGWNTFQNARLEGPRDRLRQSAHDTVADALPPPLYLVEAYLTLNLTAQTGDTPQRAELITHFAKLEQDFNDRLTFWETNQPFPQLRESILGPVKTTGQEFFFRANKDFLDAVRRNDSEATNALLTGELRRLYDNQRQAVDVLIDRSTKQIETTDAEVAQYIRTRSLTLSVSFAAILFVTILLAVVIARSIVRSVYRLRKAAVEDLPKAIAELRSGEFEPGERRIIEAVDLGTQDELADAAVAFNTVLQTAVDLAAEQAELRHHTSEVFVNLGRRNQNLVSRQLKFIDILEERETDPDLLASLFRLDHLATRMRRNAESLLVLAGVQAPRRRREAVATYDVLRSAAAEVEDYKRVTIREIDRTKITGDVMSQVTHLLAELIENAVRFSPPDTNVEVTSRVVDDTIVIEIADQGTGIAPAELVRTNRRLGESNRIDDVPTAHLGLFVVGRLASSLGIHVVLESVGSEGLVATVTLPAELVAAAERPSTPTLRDLASQTPDRRTMRHEFNPAEPSFVGAPPTTPTVHTIDSPPPAFPWGAPAGNPPVVPAAEPAPHPAASMTSTGFQRRSKVAISRPVAPAAPVATEERSAADVRSRLDGFSTGRRRGLDDTADTTPMTPPADSNR